MSDNEKKTGAIYAWTLWDGSIRKSAFCGNHDMPHCVHDFWRKNLVYVGVSADCVFLFPDVFQKLCRAVYRKSEVLAVDGGNTEKICKV